MLEPEDNLHLGESVEGLRWRIARMGESGGLRSNILLLILRMDLQGTEKDSPGGVGRLALLGTVGTHGVLTEDKDEQLSTMVAIKLCELQRGNHYATKKTARGGSIGTPVVLKAYFHLFSRFGTQEEAYVFQSITLRTR